MRNVLHPSFEGANPNVRSQLELSPNHLSDLPGTNITARLNLSRGGLVPKTRHGLLPYVDDRGTSHYECSSKQDTRWRYVPKENIVDDLKCDE
jgi:hypothetical protein